MIRAYLNKVPHESFQTMLKEHRIANGKMKIWIREQSWKDMNHADYKSKHLSFWSSLSDALFPKYHPIINTFYGLSQAA